MLKYDHGYITNYSYRVSFFVLEKMRITDIYSKMETPV